jgi:hypothetical protein
LQEFARQRTRSPFTPKERPKPEPEDKDDETADQGDDEGETDDDEDEDPEVDVDEIAEKISRGKGDRRLMKLAKKVTAENNPPQWVDDEDIWSRAKEAVGVDEDGRSEKYDQPYAVVTHVYKKMGGSIAGGKK